MFHLEPTFVGVTEFADELGADSLRHDETANRARLLALELDTGRIPASALQDVPGARGRVSGFLVVRGMVLADLTLAGRTATQLLGPGDVIAAVPDSDGFLPATRRYAVARPTTIAVLDERLLAVAQRWPAIAARLLEAGARQLERAATQQAISQLSRVELRLLALMQHLAARWGRVTADGLTVDLDLTHAMFGQLVGAKRPTVSLALKWLEEEVLLTRRRDGAWLIAPEAGEVLAAGTTVRAGTFTMAPVPVTPLGLQRGDATAA